MAAAIKSADFLLESEKVGIVPRFLQSENFTVSPKQFQNVHTVWKDGDYNSHVQIIFCGLIDERWSFDRVENPYELFNAIEIFVEKIGVLPSFPIRTARKLFDATVKRKVQNPDTNLIKYYEPFVSAPDRVPLFLRDLDLTEINTGKYIHAFDKRSMFLNACSSLQFGECEYEEIDNIDYSELSESVGLFDVQFIFKKGLSKPFFSKTLPESGYFYSPLLKFLSEFTSGIKIKKGFIFPQTKKTFDGFYKKISLGKKETSDSADAAVKTANGAIKSLYTEFFGFLRKPENADNFARDFYRPDWRGMVISQAVANLYRNAHEVEQRIFAKPFGANRDCLLYISDKADWREFAEGTCLADVNRFSHEYTLETEKVFDELGKPKMTLVEIDSLGKKKNG